MALKRRLATQVNNRQYIGSKYRSVSGEVVRLACRLGLVVAEHVSHRIAVMYVGNPVELTDMQSLFKLSLIHI